MRAKALATFNYSDNGIAVREIVKDEEFNCRDDLIEGLVAKGRIELLGLTTAGAKSDDASKQAARDMAAEKVRAAKSAFDAAVTAVAAAKEKASTAPKPERKAAWTAFDDAKKAESDAAAALKAAEDELKALA